MELARFETTNMLSCSNLTTLSGATASLPDNDNRDSAADDLCYSRI
jgi:hypothetical protein